MTTHLRPPESLNIDAGLRTRMEGKVEALEDGLHLLDSCIRALNREEYDDDDLATLREAISQMPKLSAAFEALQSHESAGPLTRLFSVRLGWLGDALTAKLGAPPQTLRAGLSAALHRAETEVRAPQPNELVLMESTHMSGGVLAFFGLVIPLIVGVLMNWWLPAAVLAAAFVSIYRISRQSQWQLTHERVFLPGEPPSQIAHSKITSVEALRAQVDVRAGGETYSLVTRAPRRLASWLELLRSNWLENLERKPRRHAICEAREEESDSKGHALLTLDGVLFIPEGRFDAVVKALSSRATSDAPSRDEVLKVLAHLPEGRWNGLGEHLASACDGAWLPRESVRTDTASGEFIGLSRKEPDASKFKLARVRLAFPLDSRGRELREEVDALLVSYAG